jgi:hypothetical protein
MTFNSKKITRTLKKIKLNQNAISYFNKIKRRHKHLTIRRIRIM